MNIELTDTEHELTTKCLMESSIQGKHCEIMLNLLIKLQKAKAESETESEKAT
tara:strand:+ start:2996 stop:3154 length:159 start_codon:yes stop_codon:yes gene_type:complete